MTIIGLKMTAANLPITAN